MKNIKAIASIGLLTMASTAAVAQPYVGAGILDGSLEIADSIDVDLPSVFVKAGYGFSDLLAVEVRGGTGVKRDKHVAGSNVNIELESFYSALVVVKAPVNEQLTAYALAGGTRANFEAKAFGSTDDESETGITYGVGADFKITESLSANAEWVSYVDKSDLELSGASIGMTMAF